MKTALYVATVARTYRKALDDLALGLSEYQSRMDWYTEQISNCTYRLFTTGFFYGRPDQDGQIYDSNTYIKEYTYLGFAEEVLPDGRIMLTQRNKFLKGETLEVMKPDGENLEAEVLSIQDEQGKELEAAPHPQQKLSVKLSVPVSVYDILRRQEK